MSTFYRAMLDHYLRVNEALFAHGIYTAPIKPDLLSVVHVAYFDSSQAYLDEIENGKIVAVFEIRDVAHLGDAAGDLQDTMRTVLHNLEIDVMWAGVGKDRSMLDTVLASKNGVIVMCKEGDTIDARIYDASAMVTRPEVNGAVLHRVCTHFWPGDYDRALNKGADAYTLTDVLVAARGATSSVNFFERLYGPRKVLEPSKVETPAKPPRPKLSDMSGFGPARDWGFQLSRDIADYRLGLIPWADVDSGLLLSSPPGGGKTMFASALAAECECEFIPTQYSEWEGSDSRITKGMEKLFAEVRKKAKDNVVIFFVDEIDSMGSRGDNGHNESWWTAVINTWLAFLDGVKGRERIVVIAATNLPDRVDSAMRRPGRLDRHIVIPLPTVDEIEGILLHHLKLDCDPYPKFLRDAARALRGRSPADIMQVARDARRHARKDRRAVRIYDVLDVLPPPRTEGPEDRIICVHEAGHAIVALDAGFGLVSIDADRAWTEVDVPSTALRQGLMDRIRLNLAGRAAEEVILGELGVGCSADLREATVLVKSFLFQMGHAQLMHLSSSDTIWPDHARAIETVLQSVYAQTVAIVARRKLHVLAIARALRKQRHLERSEVDAIIARTRAAFFLITEDRFDEADRLLGEALESDPRRLREAA